MTHVDVAGEGTVMAAWRYAQRGLSVTIADALHPPAQTFQLISNFDCLEHLEDPVGAIGQMVSRLEPDGLLALAVDFYNFDLAKSGPHLPKNFVYGGTLQIAMERLGLIGLMRGATPYLETAQASLTLWRKPAELDLTEAALTDRLRAEMTDLLTQFESFYKMELLRNARSHNRP